MKKMLKGYVLGLLSAAMLTGSVALAKNYSDYIDVTYSDIKVYVDNVLTTLTDSNGSRVEPFIYEGTTYIPVRGVAQALGCQVDWDGSSKSVYIWDNQSSGSDYLVDVCPPYETSGCSVYSASSGKSFKMAGNNYSNGFTFTGYSGSNALINLDGEYSALKCIFGHIDGYNDRESFVTFIVDGKEVKTVELEKNELPKEISIPLSYGLQLKIVSDRYVGLADMILE